MDEFGPTNKIPFFDQGIVGHSSTFGQAHFILLPRETDQSAVSEPDKYSMNYIPVFTTDLLNNTAFSKAHLLKAFQKIHATAEDISKIIVEHLRQSFGKLNQYRLIIRLAKFIFASSVTSSVKIEFHHRHCELKQFAACSMQLPKIVQQLQ